MNKRFSNYLFLLPLFLGITSCGFHLRGSLDNLSSSSLQGQKVTISVINDEQKIEADIQRALLLSNVEVVEQPEESNYQIFILNSKLVRYVSGLDTNGRTNEYEFIMQLDFVMADSSDILNDIKNLEMSDDKKNHPQRLHSADSKKNTLMVEEEKTLKVSRHYYFDTNDLIGKKTEEKTLLKEMKNHLSLQLLQQFSAFNNLNKARVKE